MDDLLGESSSYLKSPCRVRQGRKSPSDLKLVLEVILSTVSNRSRDILPLVLFNLAIIVTAFSTSFLALLMMMIYSYGMDVRLRFLTYIMWTLIPCVVIFVIYFISARNVYVDCRFLKYEQIQSHLEAYLKFCADHRLKEGSGSVKVPETVTDFLNTRSIFLAFAHKKEKDKDGLSIFSSLFFLHSISRKFNSL